MKCTIIYGDICPFYNRYCNGICGKRRNINMNASIFVSTHSLASIYHKKHLLTVLGQGTQTSKKEKWIFPFKICLWCLTALSSLTNVCHEPWSIFAIILPNYWFLPFFQIVILVCWIFFLISFQKSWDWFLRWVRYKKRNQFFKKRLPSKISDIRCWWWGCHPADAGAGFWCHPPKMMAPKSPKVLQRIQKGWRKTASSRMKNWRSFWLPKKYFFTSCDGRRISGV